MQQIKIFSGAEDQTGELEKEVNAWLRETQVKVLWMSGNIAPQSAAPTQASGSLGRGAFAPSDLILFVLYDDRKKA